jgi:hypothetical protein
LYILKICIYIIFQNRRKKKMKKLLLVLSVLMFAMIGNVFAVAGLGTAVIEPTTVVTGQEGVYPSLTITAGVGGLASFQIILPTIASTESFNITEISDPGYITATAENGAAVSIVLSNTYTGTGNLACISFDSALTESQNVWVYIGGTGVGLTINGVGLYTWEVLTLDVGADCDGAELIVTQPEMEALEPTATVTPTYTITQTSTPTAAVTVVKNASWQGWFADMAGNTTEAIQYYYVKASACAGRGDIVGQAQGVFSAGHTLVRKFNSASQFNQNTKRIRLILTPSAQQTAGALYATTLTTSYTPLLDEAEAHLNYAKEITATSSAAADKTDVKITIDVDRISEVRDWVTDHL